MHKAPQQQLEELASAFADLEVQWAWFGLLPSSTSSGGLPASSFQACSNAYGAFLVCNDQNAVAIGGVDAVCPVRSVMCSVSSVNRHPETWRSRLGVVEPSRVFLQYLSWFSPPCSSVTEVEVVIGVSVVLALAENRADKVETSHWEDNASPDLEAVVDDDTVHEEALEATIHEVEEPLLSRVGAMVEDVATGVGALLVEVLLAVPCAPLCLGHAKTLAEGKAHVSSVTFLVVGQSTSY